MNLKNPFCRDARPNSADKSEPILDVMRPWWAWGPLGLIWYGGHDSGSHNDPGQFHNPGDAGGHNHTVDPGGGFDGGAGGV
jgi:hypothetical protein